MNSTQISIAVDGLTMAILRLGLVDEERELYLYRDLYGKWSGEDWIEEHESNFS